MKKNRLIPSLIFVGLILIILTIVLVVLFWTAPNSSFLPDTFRMREWMNGTHHMNQDMNQEFNTGEVRNSQESPMELRLPPLLQSDHETDEEVAYTIMADEGQTSFRPGQPTETYGYNGSYLGPVLQIRDGQQVHINLQNELEEETTFHWHGLKVPSDVDGGPHNPISPHSSAEIDFTVEQEAATLWFHSHAHRKSGEQVYNGLAGLIFVEDENSDTLNLPKEYGVNDFPLILQERFLDEENQFRYDDVYDVDGTMGNIPLINGTIRPYIEVGPEWIRLRVVNGSNGGNYDLSLSNGSSFYQIATDGGSLEKPVERADLLLSPGERAEILINMSEYQVGEQVSLIDGSTEILELRLTKDGEEIPGPLPEKLNDLPSVETDASPDRQIEMSGRGHMVTLNGRQFDMERIDFNVEQGKKEVWEIITTPGMMMGDMPHPFHVHGVQFRILSRNGTPPEAYETGWKDTVLVSPGETVRIEIDFQKQGIFMIHCHILEHEDNGMMGQVLVE